MNYHAKSGASKLKIDQFMLNLVFGGHFVFLLAILFFGKKMRMVIMNYHGKSGASSLKIDQVMVNLVFGGHFVFFCLQNLQKGIMNYHGKSGASSLKID